MPLDLAAVRASITTLLSTTPEITTVGSYEPLIAPTNNLPYASIRLGRVPRIHKQMGQFTFDAEWRINVVLGTSQANAEIDAQQLYEVLVSRLHDTFDNDDLNLPGLVEYSIIYDSDMPAQPTSQGVWSCQFLLTTSLVTT